MEDVYIAVGSNIDAERNIAHALKLLIDATGVEAVSTIYRTKALGGTEQPDFLNGVFKIRTHLPPTVLKEDVLRHIEDNLGRVRSGDKFMDRTIDLDIIVYGEGTVAEGELRLPGREIWERPFVAAPLLELAPDLLLAGSGEALRDLESVRNLDTLMAEHEITSKLRARLNG